MLHKIMHQRANQRPYRQFLECIDQPMHSRIKRNNILHAQVYRSCKASSAQS